MYHVVCVTEPAENEIGVVGVYCQDVGGAGGVCYVLDSVGDFGVVAGGVEPYGGAERLLPGVEDVVPIILTRRSKRYFQRFR